MTEDQGLSELDSKLYQFLEENKGVDLKITIEFVEDLGIRVEGISDGSVGRSGDAISVTDALLRLLPKIQATIEEYQDQVKALMDAEGDEDA